jgi:hypothetical protein
VVYPLFLAGCFVRVALPPLVEQAIQSISLLLPQQSNPSEGIIESMSHIGARP